jgi:hypothetical protein
MKRLAMMMRRACQSHEVPIKKRWSQVSGDRSTVAREKAGHDDEKNGVAGEAEDTTDQDGSVKMQDNGMQNPIMCGCSTPRIGDGDPALVMRIPEKIGGMILLNTYQILARSRTGEFADKH